MHRHLARACKRRRLLPRIAGELSRLLEVALRLGRGAERGSPLAGLRRAPPAPSPRSASASSASGSSAVGLEQVRGDHLGYLLLGERSREVLGGGQVLGAALLLRQRLVRDLAEQVLEEAVLAVLGRARVGLEAEHLLADQAGEQRLELRLGRSGQRGQRSARERLPEHGRIAEQPPLLGRETVEAGGDQRVQRLRHLERLDLAGTPVDRAVLDEQPAVEQHPHRLDRVQRHALCAREDLVAQARRAARGRARRAAPPSPPPRAAPGRAR